MNYQKIYDALILKRRQNQLVKTKCYCETHHIIPKSLGGSNLQQNLVNLLPREHFIAHMLLAKITLQKFGKQSMEHFKMAKAYYMMARYSTKQNYCTSRIYANAKAIYVESVRHIASITNKGRKLSTARKLQNKIDSSRRRWMKNIVLGICHFASPEEFNFYLANGFVFGRIIDMKGDKNPIHTHVFTEQERSQRSKRMTGKKNPMYGHSIKEFMSKDKIEQWKKRLNGKKAWNKGKKLSAKTKLKISKTLKARKNKYEE